MIGPGGVALALAGLIALAPASGHAATPAASRVLLSEPGDASRWATVERSVVARRRPDQTSHRVAKLRTRTNEGTTNVVLALERARDEVGEAWIRVRLAVLPNGTTGWVPRSALGEYRRIYGRLIVDTTRLRAKFLRRGRVIFDAPAGIGQRRWPTPRGEFYVRMRYTGYASPAYGPLAFGTSARSAVLTDWPGGGYIGIHGTNRPDLIPGRISHGCIRLRNPDLLQLARFLRVGTPITIR